eukprot:scaffold4.g4963.t1
MAGKKKGGALKLLVDLGLVRDGEHKQGAVLAVGRAREGGIEVDGEERLLGYSAFEERSGSTYHRPAQHTHTSRSVTLQGLQALVTAAEGGGDRPAGREEEAPEAVALLEDENDEFCYLCGLGGDLLCCETCPATYHTACMGLEEPPEGDWYCPTCKCAACGSGAGFVGEQLRGGGTPGGDGGAGPSAVRWVRAAQPYVGPEALQALGRPVLDSAAPPAAAPPAANAAEEEAASAEAMDVDGPLPQAEAEQGQADLSTLVAALAEDAAVPSAPPYDDACAAVPTEQAGAAAGALPPEADIRCAVSGRRHHFGCLPAEAQRQLAQQQEQQAAGERQPWFVCPQTQQIAIRLAALCARGVVPLGVAAPAPGAASGSADGQGVAYSFQLIRGAAAAAPATCTGVAPAYALEQRRQLQRVLSAALHVLHSCFEPLLDSRTGGDTLAWLLRGAVLADGAADHSGYHTVVLYAGNTVVAAGVLHVLGPVLAELPVLAARAEVQRNRLGPLLLAAVERLLLELGVQSLLTPAFVAPGIPNIAFPEVGGQDPGAEPPPPLPLLQARWGYEMAPREALLAAAAFPLVRMPGQLLAHKRLGPSTVLAPPPLPPRLVLNADTDVRRLVREGRAVIAASPPVPAGAPAAPPPAAPPPKQEPPRAERQRAAPAQPAEPGVAAHLRAAQQAVTNNLVHGAEVSSLTTRLLQAFQHENQPPGAAAAAVQHVLASAAAAGAAAAAAAAATAVAQPAQQPAQQPPKQQAAEQPQQPQLQQRPQHEAAAPAPAQPMGPAAALAAAWGIGGQNGVGQQRRRQTRSSSQSDNTSGAARPTRATRRRQPK